MRLLAGLGFAFLHALLPASGEPWPRHVIDDSSRGADGVRLLDVDGDARPEIATAWEEGGVVRVYQNPDPDGVRTAWKRVTVGNIGSPEDAVLTDVNGDGVPDVISSCEGNTRGLFAHFAPADPNNYWQAEAWTSREFPAGKGTQWMFCLPLARPGSSVPDLIVGSKGAGASISRLRAGENPGDPAEWSLTKLADATWIMSLRAVDIDGDGDLDILGSNRKGASARVFWLENPGTPEGDWPERGIGGPGRELMFLDVADLNADGRPDIAAAAKPHAVLLFFQRPDGSWEEAERTWDPARFGTAKAVRVGDLDGDGHPDLACTTENAGGASSGVFSLAGPDWRITRDIGGPDGTKFDRIELLDLDGDQDLDLLTCEERDGLGVVWYENPARNRK